MNAREITWNGLTDKQRRVLLTANAMPIQVMDENHNRTVTFLENEDTLNELCDMKLLRIVQQRYYITGEGCLLVMAGRALVASQQPDADALTPADYAANEAAGETAENVFGAVTWDDLTASERDDLLTLYANPNAIRHVDTGLFSKGLAHMDSGITPAGRMLAEHNKLTPEEEAEGERISKLFDEERAALEAAAEDDASKTALWNIIVDEANRGSSLKAIKLYRNLFPEATLDQATSAIVGIKVGKVVVDEDLTNEEIEAGLVEKCIRLESEKRQQAADIEPLQARLAKAEDEREQAYQSMADVVNQYELEKRGIEAELAAARENRDAVKAAQIAAIKELTAIRHAAYLAMYEADHWISNAGADWEAGYVDIRNTLSDALKANTEKK